MLYPSTTYAPDMAHCAFGFNVNCELVKIDRSTIMANPDIEAQTKAFDAAVKDITDKFPSTKAIKKNFPWNEWDSCKKFSGLKEGIIYMGEGAQSIITHKSLPFAPSLEMKMTDSFLSVGLHNCATPTLAVVMYMHGLHALKSVYTAYDIPTDFLPTIGFDGDNLIFDIPFQVPKDTSRGSIREQIEYHAKKTGYNVKLFPKKDAYGPISIKGETAYVQQIDPKNGKFSGRVEYKRHNMMDRNSIAIHLFNMARMQSQILYNIIDYGEESQP